MKDLFISPNNKIYKIGNVTHIEKTLCCRCGSKSNLINKNTRKSKDGYIITYKVCNKCNTKRLKDYRKTDNGKRTILKAIRKWEKNNPQKIKSIRNVCSKRYQQKAYTKPKQLKKFKARWILQSKIKHKQISSMPCVVCGNNNTQAHHEDYNKPLSIIWLCQKHHLDLHYGFLNLDRSKVIIDYEKLFPVVGKIRRFIGNDTV